MQVRQLLYPTDFSPLARTAFPHALQFARCFGARLHLLHVLPTQAGVVIDPMVPYPVFAATDERAEREAIAALEGLATEAAAAGVDVVTAHPRVNTVDGILAYVEREAIDLTVMATHGRSGPARLLFGSVAEEVLRHGSRPVLAVHGGDERAAGAAPRVDKILVPFDFSPFSRAGLIEAVDLARRWGSRLQLLHVLDELPADVAGAAAAAELRSAQECRVKELRLRLLDLLTHLAAGLQGEVVVRIGRPGPEILRMASEGGVDLIVMATHAVTGIKRVLLGSVAEDVVRGAVAPVLVIKPELAEPQWKTRAGRPADRVPLEPTAR